MVLKYIQSHSNQSSWSSFGWTTISQGEKFHLIKGVQSKNKNDRVIFGVVELIILQYSR